MAKYALPDHQYRPLEPRGDLTHYYEVLGRKPPPLRAGDACMVCMLDEDLPPSESSYVWRFSPSKHPFGEYDFVIFEKP